MNRTPAPTLRTRAAACGSTLLVHLLVLLLLLQEDRVERSRPLPPRVLPVNVWIHLPPLETPTRPATGEVTIALRGQPAPAPVPVPEFVPRRAIVLPPADAPAPTPEQRAGVDWYAEASKLAARAAQDEGPSDGFGEPLQKMREPCEPRESSFKWNPEQKKYGLLPLPYIVIGEACVIGLGFFGCALGSPPEPNSHLFDDMRAGRTPESSVPHPNYCD